MSWFYWRGKTKEEQDEERAKSSHTDKAIDDVRQVGHHRNITTENGVANHHHEVDDEEVAAPTEEDISSFDSDEMNAEDNLCVNNDVLPKSAEIMTAEDDDDEEDGISIIDEDSTDVDSLDDDFLESSDDDEEENSSYLEAEFIQENAADTDDDENNEGQEKYTAITSKNEINNSSPPDDSRPAKNLIKDQSREEEDETDDDDDDDGEQVPTSFWEKQALLVLAAEHDRVDILKAILSDEEDDRDTLMSSGIPPLHLAITFGSVNATVALLRMGADPSVRPNVDGILEQQKDQPDDSKVEIPNIKRFDGVSAWELAFGNKNYEEKILSKKPKSWSLFRSSSSSLAAEMSRKDKVQSDAIATTRVIKPVDMPPSKREGVRHAFTAEALRSVGGDDVNRLDQLLDSGMPATIDIGGKDLYGWAVEMGALRCEELLRPTEAAKYGCEPITSVDKSINDAATGHGVTTKNIEAGKTHVNQKDIERQNSSFVVHRPAEESVPQLVNRLDELESLASALSTCLDNLAEEVSVCHGLLLMGGGASALASHVKSLKSLKDQKLIQLELAHIECQLVESELLDLVKSAGDVGREIADIAAFKLFDGLPLDKTILSVDKKLSSVHNKEDNEVELRNLMTQIAVSENKIRKLRSSIADLSEENARDLKEVERRGLEGGINLVRGLREELRDIEFQLSECRSTKAEFKTKINMIHAHFPNLLCLDVPTEQKPVVGETHPLIDAASDEAKDNSQSKDNEKQEMTIVKSSTDDILRTITVTKEELTESPVTKDSTVTGYPLQDRQHPKLTIDPSSPTKPNRVEVNQKAKDNKTATERIATGDSQALAIVQPGNRGFFTVDLWQVLLRIIGFERAAYRRGVEIASSQPNVMIV